MEQVIDLLKKAYGKMKEAACQSHGGHWDSNGTHGANCPECIRATRLNGEAVALYDRAMKLMRDIESMS